MTEPTIADIDRCIETIERSDKKWSGNADYRSFLQAELFCLREVKARLTADDWRDDPSADERWQAGCDFAMVHLCKALGVDPQSVRWDAATETLDGDVIAVIWNILRAKMGDDWDPDAPTRQVCGACGQPWTGEACGQKDNGHPFPTCYPHTVERT